MIIKHPTCPTCCDGEITVEMSASSKPYLFSIDGGNTWKGADNPFGSYATFTNLCAGSYDIVVNYSGNTSNRCIADKKIILEGKITENLIDCNIPEGFVLIESEDFLFYEPDTTKSFTLNHCCLTNKIISCNELLSVSVNTLGVNSVESFVSKIAFVLKQTFNTNQVVVTSENKKLKLLVKKDFIPNNCSCENSKFSWQWENSNEVEFKTKECCSYDDGCTNPLNIFTTEINDLDLNLDVGGTVNRPVSIKIKCGNSEINSFSLGSYSHTSFQSDNNVTNLVNTINANAILAGYDIKAVKLAFNKIELKIGKKHFIF